jgi:hypothetical protein
MGRADGGWRIVVRIGAGQPELQAALAAVPARARAERLRQLALMGLCRLPHEVAPVRPQESAEEPTLQARRERLLQGLLGDGD